MAHYSGSGAHGKFPTEPTDTMIVRNLDLNSTEKSISDAFGYITKELFIRILADLLPLKSFETKIFEQNSRKLFWTFD